MVFNATFNNISVLSWRPVLLVEETGVPGEIRQYKKQKMDKNEVNWHLVWYHNASQRCIFLLLHSPLVPGHTGHGPHRTCAFHMCKLETVCHNNDSNNLHLCFYNWFLDKLILYKFPHVVHTKFWIPYTWAINKCNVDSPFHKETSCKIPLHMHILENTGFRFNFSIEAYEKCFGSQDLGLHY